MKNLKIDQNYSVPEHFTEEQKIDVKITFMLKNKGDFWFGPMICSGSIHRGRDLNQMKQFFENAYKKEGYAEVQLTKVEIDLT